MRAKGHNGAATKGNGSADIAAVLSADEYVSKIKDCWQGATKSILETGRWLIAAKAKLPHGEFGKMIRNKLPFGDRTAQMLMTIARHPVLSNPKYISHLPPSWATLHDIAATAYPPGVLEDLLDRGLINPETTQQEHVAVSWELVGEMPRALAKLIKFAVRWDPDTMAKTLGLHGAMGGWSIHEKPDIEALGKLSAWIAELQAACQRWYDDEGERRKKEALKIVSYDPPLETREEERVRIKGERRAAL